METTRGPSNPTIATPFQYQGAWGGYTDSETGLVLQGHRLYDPATGRWLTRDPIGYAGGINLYGYVGGDPVNRRDPSGLLYDAATCARKLESIKNVQKRIRTRIGELQEDRETLPDNAPFDDIWGSLSRNGHRRLINMDKALLAAKWAEYYVAVR